MSAPLATDWTELLLTPVWTAMVAVLLFFLLVAFRRPLADRLGRLGISRLSLFGVDVEWIADRAAEAYRARQLSVPGSDQLRAIAVLSAHLAPLVRDRRILWVDDQPRGNAVEAGLLRRLGVEIEGATDTDAALTAVSTAPAPFDLVISDWDRGGGDDALDLVRRLRAEGMTAPVVVYAGFRDAERIAKAANAGIVALTVDPDGLLKQVLIELSLT